MKLNTLSPASGARKNKKRVGRGAASGVGKTAGRGHKGQKSRSGGFTKIGFEGGQMPLQRRVPKKGFRSRLAKVTDEIRLNELEKVEGEVVDMISLRKAGLITSNIRRARIIASGEVKSAVTVRGLGVSKGAKAAIEAAGGSVEA